MNRIDYLMGRAAALRDIAETIDIQSIRDRVLALSEECVQLAQLVGKPITEEQIGRSLTEAFVHPQAKPHAKGQADRKQRS
ncbi:MAG TPA: hypothetical protein VNW24_01180 [Stellaceae bacterium]|jgi:hypothetical protein|nr:hypothetical protein [Stellaceae bacterium]